MATLKTGEWFRESTTGGASDVFRGVAGGSASANIVLVGNFAASPIIYTTPRLTIQDPAPVYTARSAAGTDPLRDVAFRTSGTEFVAVGDNGRVETSTDDGVTWLAQAITSADLKKIYQLASDTNNRFLVVGDGEIWGKDLAGVWTLRDSGPELWRGIGFRSGTGFVAVGTNQDCATSPTGLAGSWSATYQVSGSGDDFADIASSFNLVMAVGQNGSAWRSPTGLAGSWVDVSVPGSPDLVSVSITGDFQGWVAFDSSGNFWSTDDDGDTWTARGQVSQNASVVRLPGVSTAVAAGASGTAWVSYLQTQEDFQSSATEPASALPLGANDDMSGDAVRRLVTQFRSGRG